MGVSLTGDAVFGEAGATNNLFDVLVGLRNSLENNDVHGIQSPTGSTEYHSSRFDQQPGRCRQPAEPDRDEWEYPQNLELSNTDRLTEIEDVDAIQAITDLKREANWSTRPALYSATQVGQLSLVDFMR